MSLVEMEGRNRSDLGHDYDIVWLYSHLYQRRRGIANLNNKSEGTFENKACYLGCALPDKFNCIFWRALGEAPSMAVT